MELLGTVVIPNYIRVIKISESRRATYYKIGEDIPKKYSDKLGKEYHWMYVDKKKDKFLVDADGELIIKNPNSQGTPKYKIINGQDLHRLTLKDYDRAKIVRAIKEQMTPEIEKLDIITKLPIRILCEMYDTYTDVVVKSNPDWDVDNRLIFHTKVFVDVLSGSPSKVIVIDNDTGKPMINHKTGKPLMEMKNLSKAIIPNDHRKYVTQPPVPLFFPIEDIKQRKLVFKIYHDDRDIIKNHKDYNYGGISI